MTDNRAAFEHFVELFYTRKRVAESFDYLVADDYRKHTPNIADGPAAAAEALSPKFDGSQDATFSVERARRRRLRPPRRAGGLTGSCAGLASSSAAGSPRPPTAANRYVTAQTYTARGVIAPGAHTDLTAASTDPLEDVCVHAETRLDWVMQGGKLVQRRGLVRFAFGVKSAVQARAHCGCTAVKVWWRPIVRCGQADLAFTSR